MDVIEELRSTNRDVTVFFFLLFFIKLLQINKILKVTDFDGFAFTCNVIYKAMYNYVM